MQAISLAKPGGLEAINVRDIESPPAPGAGEIAVSIKASSLNYHDLLVALGLLETEDQRVLMSDGAGVVSAVGQDVTEFSVGDHVVSTFFPQWLSGEAVPDAGSFALTPGDGVDGMAAKEVVRSADAFTLAPKNWSHAESATITTAGVTAWRALITDGKLKAGDTVLTQGTGGVSLAALQIAKMMGAKVIITSSSDEKLEKAKALGADVTINYKTHESWSDEVLKATGGAGVDHIIELGGPDTLGQSINAIRVGGHISIIGVLTGFDANLPVLALLGKQARLQGLIVGSKQDQKDYVKALESNDVSPVIDKTFSYTDTADAFKYQQSGKHFGKICLTWDE